MSALASTPAAQATSPYVGPLPFRPDQDKIFFGRERETKELFALAAGNRELLLYAQSGAGKTSLLNAGLLQQLKQRFPVVLGPTRVTGTMPKGMDPAQIPNIYMFHALQGWDPTGEPGELARKSLADFLKVKPPRETECLGANGAGPDSADGAKAEPARTEAPYPPTLLIVDQVEELFEFYPQYRECRKDFFRQLGDAMEWERHVRVILSMREDYLAHLDSYSDLLPQHLRARYRLERLRKPAALLAVTEPLKAVPGRCIFEEGVSEKLVDDLLKSRIVNIEGTATDVTGEFVEPVQLQVVCDSLWQALPPGTTRITADHLKEFGDVNEALSRFYESCIADSAQVPGVTERELRSWFGSILITQAGTRGKVVKGRNNVGGIPLDAVKILEKRHIIRSEQWAGSDWYELNHDRLIDPILKSNERWLARRGPALGIKRRLEARAEEWVKSGRDPSKLLDEVDLTEAERWMKCPEAADLGYSGNLTEFCNVSRAVLGTKQAESVAEAERLRSAAEHLRAEADRQQAEWQRSRAESERRAAMLYRWLAVVLGAAVLGALGAVGLAVRQRNQANDARELSELGAIENQVLVQQNMVARLEGEVEQKEKERLNQMSLAQDWQIRAVKATEEREATALQQAANVAAHTATELEQEAETLRAERQKEAQTVLKLREQVEKLRPGVVQRTGKGKRKGPTPSELAAAATKLLNGEDPELATLFAIEAVNIDTKPPQAAVDALYRVLAGNRVLEVFREDEANVWGVTFRPDGKQIVSGCSDQKARVWDIQTGELVNTFGSHEGVVFDVAYSRGGKLFATGSSDGTANVWSVNGDQTMFRCTISGQSAGINSLAFSPDGQRLLTGGNDKMARLWDTATCKEEKVSFRCAGAVYGVAFSRDGERIATASEDAKARVWQLNGSMEAELKHRDAVIGVCFNHDGTRLVSSSRDQTARIWEIGNKKLVNTLKGHKGMLGKVAYSPDGKLIATTGSDGLVKVWNADGTPLYNLMGHAGPVFGVAFNEDSSRLVSGGFDKTVRLWSVVESPEPVPPGLSRDQLLTIARQRVSRVLTTAECKQHLGTSNCPGIQ